MIDIFSLSGLRLGNPKMIDGNIAMPANSKQKFAKCPCCNKKSKRVHSSYNRVLRDLPASTQCVSINLTVRKFFCKNPKCERKIFTEQPGDEIKPYSRFTNRTRKRLQKIFIEVSANKGAYISELISLPVSASTGLRLVDSIPIPETDKISILGIDDWAYRKGLSYGTILVNIETRTVIDILPGRDGISLKKWLKHHPEIITVTRDRASTYSCAVSEMLPNAIQVTDRFHLLKNLSDCVYDIIKLEYRSLANSLIEGSSSVETMPPDFKNEEPNKVLLKEKGERNDYSKSQFEKVKKLQEENYGYRTIAKVLKISRNTVRRYAKLDTLPKKSIYIRNNYSEYLDIIEKELIQSKSIKGIFEIISKAGFKGSMTAFYEYFKDHPLRKNITINTPTIPAKHQMISPRKISRYLRFEELSKIKDSFERKIMISLLSKNTLLEKLRKLSFSFRDMLLGDDDTILEDWFKMAIDLGKSQLKTFVNGLKSDIDAVRNAIITNWSNGQVEGQVNRLKSIKRQMYGKASFNHLRRKVILSKAG